MAEHMKDHRTNRRYEHGSAQRAGSSLAGSHFAWLRACAVCGFCMLAAAPAAAADILRDPTRPPPGLYAAEDGAEVETGPVLQSVRVAQGRYTAVISGETVRVGSRYGDARVVRIRETEVVLKTGNSLQTLKLFPDVEKRPAADNKRSKR